MFSSWSSSSTAATTSTAASTRGPSAVLRGLGDWLGIEIDEVGPTEKLVSGLGGAVSIVLVILISDHALGLHGSAALVASMGASAVLLFAVPHGQLSQPWPVVAGHVGGAFIGVTCAQLIGPTTIAAGLAVGLTILAMHQFKAIHPPGGATALTAVVGGPAITDMGFGFVGHPVLANALAIVAVAVLFNYAFRWRRYPVHLGRVRSLDTSDEDELSHDDVLDALRSLDSFVDITEDDLRRLHHLFTHREPGDGRPQD
ncbi:MAG: HPP family protein [Actinomycetota bacterium]|nr:HPP family protein [Actinomycetota bacterium]